MTFEVAHELKDLFEAQAPFKTAQSLKGRVYRELEQRKTLAFEHNQRQYFIKMHFGTTWREIVKNLIQLKWPVLGASNEWFALHHLPRHQVNTAKPLAYFDNLAFPTKRKSFVVMSALNNFIDLEHLAKHGQWRALDSRQRKLMLKSVATLARNMHACGIQHRDFYVCHILLPRSWLAGDKERAPELTVIDLHRAVHRNRLGRRRLVKDMSALFYSTMADAGLTGRERAYFIRQYSSESIKENLGLWQDVAKKADSLRRKAARKQLR